MTNKTGRKIFNKLVRDKIPEIILKNGGDPETEILKDAQYAKFLDEKLLEECGEVINASDKDSKTEELADALEIIHAIAENSGVSFEQIEDIRLKKLEKRGGFSSKIFLKSTSMVENLN